MNNYQVCIDCGHGGHDVGGSFNDVHEKDITLSVGLSLREELQELGFLVMMTRTTDKYVGLTERITLANKASEIFKPVDAFISIHTNADPDPDEPGMGEGRGEEIWIPQRLDGSPDPASFALATAMQDEVNDIIPDKSFRGIKTGNFTVLAKAKMPAVLVELGFLDSVKDFPNITTASACVRTAKLLAVGINDYFNVDH